MANTQAQFGFKHIGYLSGGATDYQQVPRAIQSSNTTKIGFGDPVIKANLTSLYITQCTGSAAATGILEGIFVGTQFTPSGGLGIPQWSPFWPGAAASDATGYVINAPNALFLVATTNTAIATASIGQCVNFTTGTTSVVGGGFSIATVDQSTLATTTGTTLPFKVVGMYQGVGNGSDPTTAFNWVIVTFNNQSYKSLIGF